MSKFYYRGPSFTLSHIETVDLKTTDRKTLNDMYKALLESFYYAKGEEKERIGRAMSRLNTVRMS